MEGCGEKRGQWYSCSIKAEGKGYLRVEDRQDMVKGHGGWRRGRSQMRRKAVGSAWLHGWSQCLLPSTTETGLLAHTGSSIAQKVLVGFRVLLHDIICLGPSWAIWDPISKNPTKSKWVLNIKNTILIKGYEEFMKWFAVNASGTQSYCSISYHFKIFT